MSRGRPFRTLVSLEEALERVLSRVGPVDRTETIPIDEALDRVLAKDIKATMDVPGFERSAMDGYAVRAEDTYGATDMEPLMLRPVGTVHAGEVPSGTVGEGECMYVATGAMRPEGADSVVMVEYTEEVDGGTMTMIRRAVHPGENVSRRDADIMEGTVPLRAGARLGASRIGTAAALGILELQVYARPVVAIAGTGNEVRPLGAELGPGHVYDINTHTISAAVRSLGGTALVLGLVRDSHKSLTEALDKALEMADIAVFTGGSSVGERDLLVDVFGERGEVLFHGVQVKPGKPVLAADCGGKLALGLPGYPTSCLSSGMLFLEPVMAKMGRRSQATPVAVDARLSRRVVSTIGRTHFLTVRLEDGTAHPAFKESGAITSMAEADGYVIIPSNVDLIDQGEQVEVHML
ncbi:MAG: molybdenum cofactor biosynthesis protein [Thermoplasmata archaeon]|nr:molybdenum cofactor biosynthesis protein [Thermoplasmata archaeon]